jgi:hypothetical protein
MLFQLFLKVKHVSFQTTIMNQTPVYIVSVSACSFILLLLFFRGEGGWGGRGLGCCLICYILVLLLYLLLLVICIVTDIYDLFQYTTNSHVSFMYNIQHRTYIQNNNIIYIYIYIYISPLIHVTLLFNPFPHEHIVKNGSFH